MVLLGFCCNVSEDSRGKMLFDFHRLIYFFCWIFYCSFFSVFYFLFSSFFC